MNDSLAFLISDVARAMRRRFDERARQLGVTQAQWKVLLSLDREEGLNQGVMAERIEVEPITLCRMIDRLEDNGLVERRADPAYRRAWRIFLTDAARPVIAQLRRLADDLFDGALCGVPRDDRDRLIAALQTIRTNLTAKEIVQEVARG